MIEGKNSKNSIWLQKCIDEQVNENGNITFNLLMHRSIDIEWEFSSTSSGNQIYNVANPKSFLGPKTPSHCPQRSSHEEVGAISGALQYDLCRSFQSFL